MKLDKQVLVIDVESSCWEPKNTQPSNEIQEIIEIGIAVVDTKALSIVSTDSIIVKPQQSKVSDFCTQLTTLTQQQVDQGVLLSEAFQTLQTKFNSKNRLFISWGDFDRNLFTRNATDYNLQYPFGARHLNLKNCFALLHGLPSELSVGKALDYLCMSFIGTQHRGDDDAKNIARILIDTLEQFRIRGINQTEDRSKDW
jgi:inhibitor of KinA sporulation pathway (predicted exonuclease)